jgi:hypothetical protein
MGCMAIFCVMLQSNAARHRLCASHIRQIMGSLFAPEGPVLLRDRRLKGKLVTDCPSCTIGTGQSEDKERRIRSVLKKQWKVRVCDE